jgi:7-carboxy-7-deazaguanine synthase
MTSLPVTHEPTLRVNEVFHSIQGESTRVGVPMVFVRLTGCPLRCRYCDTSYAFREGTTVPVTQLLDRVRAFRCPTVEFTGGEPLAQRAVFAAMATLCDEGFTVLVETSGAVDIAPCHPRVIRILDLKTPGSGEVDRNRWENLADLRPHDEVKFVITDRHDYDWAREVIGRERLHERCHAVLMSAAHRQAGDADIEGCDGLPHRSLAEWILADRLPVRQQGQLHKVIWDPAARGV